MDNFKPVYLYIKKHNISGMLYFGRTVKKNIEKYKGSGKYWKLHIDKHGKNDITTLWCEKFNNEEDLVEFAIFFSEEFNIVNSDKWANLKEENGLHNSNTRPKERNYKHSLETINKIKHATSGVKKTILNYDEYINIRSSTYELTLPNGNNIIVKNLKKYCIENNLNQSALYQVALGKRKHHKKYICKKIGE